VADGGHRRGSAPRRPGRLHRLAERIVLGAVVGVATWVLERRLRKALGKKRRRPSRGRTIELS
jgi:hypothetical protein